MIPDQRKYTKQHLKNMEKYSRQIRKQYSAVIDEISNMANISFTPGDEFYFRNYPELNKKMDKLMDTLYSNVTGITVSGINTEWDLAVEQNNALAKYAFGSKLKDMPKDILDKYLSGNQGALENFMKRKTNGLGLSDRIWRNTQQMKSEMELALELELGKGKSASSIATKLKDYLNHPDKLFRRVKDAKGVLRLSKAAKAYNPGQGRYRSSYKNALRVTRNETNFSYEGSNYEKRKQMDFIVGVEIKVSPQHSPYDDTGGISCIELQGKYPKDFDWTYKWHVNCKCMSLHILKSEKELDEDVDLILEGKEPKTTSVNSVKSVPGNYIEYLKKNEEKWANWANRPRTFENNKQ